MRRKNAKSSYVELHKSAETVCDGTNERALIKKEVRCNNDGVHTRGEMDLDRHIAHSLAEDFNTELYV